MAEQSVRIELFCSMPFSLRTTFLELVRAEICVRLQLSQPKGSHFEF